MQAVGWSLKKEKVKVQLWTGKETRRIQPTVASDHVHEVLNPPCMHYPEESPCNLPTPLPS